MSKKPEAVKLAAIPDVFAPPLKVFALSSVITRAISLGASRQTKFLLVQGCNLNHAVGPRRLFSSYAIVNH